jgi:hypothetical protein
MQEMKEEVASAAARMVVEEGLEYGVAKRRAIKQLGFSQRAAMPDNEQVELAVEAYIRLFCADTQALELRVLRQLALVWMRRLADFRPYLSGRVWRGTATKDSDIYVNLFCDDSKSAEIALIDQDVRFEVHSTTGFNGKEIDVLSIHARSRELGVSVGVHLLVFDFDDLRGAIKPDSRGKSPRGDIASVERLLNDSNDLNHSNDSNDSNDSNNSNNSNPSSV